MSLKQPEAATPNEQDVCPHCGAVLEVALALRENRSVLAATVPADEPDGDEDPAE